MAKISKKYIPKDTEKYMCAKHLAYFKQKLMEWKKDPEENRLEINQWLMAQMGLIGPMIGQHHQFHYYHQGKSEWGEERYFKITRKLYDDLEARLSASDYLAGKEYSIADIATWSWIARHKRHDIGLENFKGLARWYVDIAKRPAVIKGFKLLNKDAEIDYP